MTEKKQRLSYMLYPPLEHRQVYIYIYLYMQKSGRRDRNTTHPPTHSWPSYTYVRVHTRLVSILSASSSLTHATVLLSLSRRDPCILSHPTPPSVSSVATILSSPILFLFISILASHRTSRPRITNSPLLGFRAETAWSGRVLAIHYIYHWFGALGVCNRKRSLKCLIGYMEL